MDPSIPMLKVLNCFKARWVPEKDGKTHFAASNVNLALLVFVVVFFLTVCLGVHII